MGKTHKKIRNDRYDDSYEYWNDDYVSGVKDKWRQERRKQARKENRISDKFIEIDEDLNNEGYIP